MRSALAPPPPPTENGFPFAPERAKKVRNKAVVNTAALTPESKTGNSKLLPVGGNSRMAGKLGQGSTSKPATAGHPGGLVQGILAFTLGGGEQKNPTFSS